MMKATVGRIGQYRVLMSDDRIKKHLLETDMLTEKNLFEFVEKYKTIAIKPLNGPGEICISTVENQYEILSHSEVTTTFEKKEVYQFLQKELNKKYYIIQPKKLRSKYLKSPFHYYVTVHRNSISNEWCLKSKTEIDRTLFGKYFYMCFMRRIEKISILAAEILGKFYPNCRTIVIDILYDLKGSIWIQDTFLQFSRSKWTQYHNLSECYNLLPFIPETALLTRVTYNDFFSRYNEIILKPWDGQQGKGVVQISTNDQFTFDIHSGRKKRTIFSQDKTYLFIEETYLSKSHYIIQPRLSLATINDCPMDIRVIVQKCDSEWKVTGKAVKVAAKGFFITNAAQRVLLLEEALQQSNINNKDIGQLISDIDSLCIAASIELEKYHSNIYIIGFDICITPNGDLWIIEGNYRPDLSMFSILEDKEVMQNISETQKAYHPIKKRQKKILIE
jgi:hypothetical protein